MIEIIHMFVSARYKIWTIVQPTMWSTMWNGTFEGTCNKKERKKGQTHNWSIQEIDNNH
jgi:hypothetical protein